MISSQLATENNSDVMLFADNIHIWKGHKDFYSSCPNIAITLNSRARKKNQKVIGHDREIIELKKNVVEYKNKLEMTLESAHYPMRLERSKMTSTYVMV